MLWCALMHPQGSDVFSVKVAILKGSCVLKENEAVIIIKNIGSVLACGFTAKEGD